MPTVFVRTMRSLDSDGFGRAGWGLAIGAAILSAWVAWALLGRITLYEMSTSARLEVERANYSVQAPQGGRVTATFLTAGKEVQAGDLLVELEASGQQLMAREERTRLNAVLPEIEALRAQIAAEQQAREQEKLATQAVLSETLARTKQAEAPAKYNAAEEERLKALRDQGLISARDFEKGRANAEETGLNVQRERLALERVEREQRTREMDRETRIRGLQGEIARLEGTAATGRAAISRLENDITLRAIRSPINGRLAEAAQLRTGSVVKEGDVLGTIVPDGRMMVVAQFPPPAAFGRLAAGQPAQVRFDGFPWMQWGSVATKVERVAGEVRDGKVRVELALDPAQSSRVPLQHGLPGTVEVTVDRVSPATLILRTAGSLLAAPRPNFPVAASANQ